ncbi:LacI family DNA-binding transcriptional regulator [Oceaniglobus trochenteri]|uniref:LacI family DNA-binding transcriptional regulator n=1 Tax=Oceaniglobus trochenteri TaxID=2763260 RepID=UPI001CFFF729|nr:LacI family DNA-binding transcriptional regulator [Oceaniglobus trochenteri]
MSDKPPGRGLSRPQRSRVTLDDVAAHAEVSRSTASLVVRNSKLITAETTKKVRRSIAALGYTYNQAAANLRTQRSKTLGMIIADLSNPFYALVASGIESECGQHRYVTVFADAREDADTQTMIVNRFIENDVAGIFLCPSGNDSAQNLDRLQEVGIPSVLFMRHIQGYDASYIGPDNVAGMRAVVAHLVEQGHRRIGFVGGPPKRSSGQERLDGFLQGMRDHGLTPRAEHVVAVPTIDRQAAHGACLALLDAGDPPTALVCYNDLMAFGAMLAMIRRGLTPGKDIAVTGFDDIPESVLWTPSLTTISIDAENIGRMAARALLARIENPDQPPERMIVAPRLIARESSARRF